MGLILIVSTVEILAQIVIALIVAQIVIALIVAQVEVANQQVARVIQEHLRVILQVGMTKTTVNTQLKMDLYLSMICRKNITCKMEMLRSITFQ